MDPIDFGGWQDFFAKIASVPGAAGGRALGADLHFPKSFKKSALLAKKKKFPKICHSWQLVRWREEISEK